MSTELKLGFQLIFDFPIPCIYGCVNPRSGWVLWWMSRCVGWLTRVTSTRQTIEFLWRCGWNRKTINLKLPAVVCPIDVVGMHTVWLRRPLIVCKLRLIKWEVNRDTDNLTRIVISSRLMIQMLQYNKIQYNTRSIYRQIALQRDTSKSICDLERPVEWDCVNDIRSRTVRLRD